MWFKKKHLEPSQQCDKGVREARKETVEVERKLAELQAGKRDRDQLRDEAKALRALSENALVRNHFGEALAASMHRRGA